MQCFNILLKASFATSSLFSRPLRLDLYPSSTFTKQGRGGGQVDGTASPRTGEIISIGQFHPVILVVLIVDVVDFRCVLNFPCTV